MKFLVLALTIAVTQFAVAADDDVEARKKLVGVWKGRVDRGAKGHELTFTTKQIVGKKDKNQDLGEGTFKLDLKKKPLQMDATESKGSRKGKVYLGIYSLKGDTLRWCVSTPGKKRPTKFVTEGSQFLLILKRQKD